MSEPVVEIQVAGADVAEMERIVLHLLERRLIACAQVTGEITSRYWWKGTIETSRERLCLLKTTAAASSAVVAAVRDLHSYATPEILVLRVAGGSPEYLDWVRESVVAPPA